MQSLKKLLSLFSAKEKVVYGVMFVIEVCLLILFVRACKENFTVKKVDPTPSPTPTMTCIPTPTPTATNTPTPNPTSIPTPTFTPTLTPTPEPLPQPSSNGYFSGKPGLYSCEVNGKHKAKPYTDYTNYNAPGTPQNALQRIAETNGYGIRVVKDASGLERMCIALGTAWAGGQPSDIGRCIDVYMVNGTILYCVLADVKKVEDTHNNRYGRINNDLLEFIVEQRSLPVKAREGDISNCGEMFQGEAKWMDVKDEFIPGFGK